MRPALPDSPLAHRFHASPNHGERLAAPDAIILHYTGMNSGEAALAWLCNGASEVSCHYFVDETGQITQLVREERRAWHAGVSLWAGEPDMNSRSIGIEIVNPGHLSGCPPYPPQQIAAIIELCRDIASRHSIPPKRILAHSDIAPARKRDPGEAFPWEALFIEGVGHWVQPHPLGGGRFLQHGDNGQPVEALQTMLAMVGYGLPVTGSYDDATMQVVAAFQRHFRQVKVDGVADASTIATLRDVLAKP